MREIRKKIPETLEDAIKLYGIEEVYLRYKQMMQTLENQKALQAAKKKKQK
jgi:hypothetical protein